MLTIKESIAKIPLYQLNISTRAFNQLCSVDIRTVEQFVYAIRNDSQALPLLSPNTIRITTKHLEVLSKHADQNNPNWIEYSRKLEIPIIPLNHISDSSSNTIFEEIPGVIEKILDDERRWYIVERRFGFNNSTKLTLQDLGETFSGITRQRIDQISDTALKKLKAVLITQRFNGEKCRVHPEILKFVKKIIDLLIEYASSGILESQIIKQICESFELDITKAKPVLLLLFELADFNSIDFSDSNLTSVWGKFSKKESRIYKILIPKVDKLVTVDTVHPQKEFDVLRLINRAEPKHLKFTITEIRNAIRLCNTVEMLEDGSCWGKFEYLRGRGNQVERLLIEISKPLSIDKIVREINHRLIDSNHRKANRRNVVNQLSIDKRFDCIGKSGHWRLKTWEHIDTANIIDLMEECLIKKNKPATVKEIYEYVVDRRPADTVEMHSITAYLATKKEVFAKHDRLNWKLTRWNEPDGELWGLDQVASFVNSLFKKNKTKILEYKIVKQALMASAGITAKQANGMLNINPIVKTNTNEKKILIAILQEDYHEKLSKVKSYGFGSEKIKKTLVDKIGERVKVIIETSPNKQILLSELVNNLRKEFTFKSRTGPYSYIDRLEFVEKIVLPGQRYKVCCIKEKLTFSQIEQISNNILREKIKRAVSFLNLDDVDIGLFLLGKEFEATLKRYLQQAYSTSGKWKSLDAMISFIAKEGIITDKAILNYLRQKRNDRAHGTMPSLDERQIIMNNVRSSANLYIDYIKFFDDLTNQL